MSETKRPLYVELNEKRTQGEWSVNHWENGKSGVRCNGSKDGINYFSGDAVRSSFYGIRSKIDPLKYNISGSFEGAHIADIPDFNELESKANAQYTALAVNNLHHLAEALQGMLDEFESYAVPASKYTQVKETVNKAKDALSRIS